MIGRGGGGVVGKELCKANELERILYEVKNVKKKVPIEIKTKVPIDVKRKVTIDIKKEGPFDIKTFQLI